MEGLYKTILFSDVNSSLRMWLHICIKTIYVQAAALPSCVCQPFLGLELTFRLLYDQPNVSSSFLVPDMT